MFGNPQVQKLGADANGTTGFADGWYSTAGFLADPRSPNAPFLDALQLVIPGSGSDALVSFSVIASGTVSNADGNCVFNLCLAAPPPPALTPDISSQEIFLDPSNSYQKAVNNPQQLPTPCASINVFVGFFSAFLFQADVDVASGALSGAYFLTLNGSEMASGPLTNLPTNLSQPIAAMLQIAQMPPAASISNIIIQVSVAGYRGPLQTLNL